MKSKRANKFLADERVAFRTGGTYYVIEVDARKAIELAEDDARERAVRALRDDCKNQDCDLALLGEPCGNCEVLERFLYHYDNDVD